MVDTRDVRGFRVTGVRGEHDGQGGTVAVWPIFDRQDWVNVGWDDGSISTAHPGDITVPDEARQIARHAEVEARLTQLNRTPKRDLLTLISRLARERGTAWAVGGPAGWSKDELMRGILRFEFPDPPEATQ